MRISTFKDFRFTIAFAKKVKIAIPVTISKILKMLTAHNSFEAKSDYEL